MRYHVTDLGLMAECEAKHGWRVRDRLVPKYDGPARPLGAAIHSGLEALWKGASGAQALAQALGRWNGELPPATVSELKEEDQTKVRQAREQLVACLTAYPFKTGDYDAVYDVEGELQWHLPSGKVVVGRVDRRVRTAGLLWVHDAKSTGGHVPLVARAHRVRMQYAAYAWLSEMNGAPVAGVIMELIGKPRVYERKDGTYSIGRPVYHREPIVVTRAMRERFVTWAEKLVERIEMDSRLMNDAACSGFGRICPYIELCGNPGKAERLKEGFDRRESRA